MQIIKDRSQLIRPVNRQDRLTSVMGLRGDPRSKTFGLFFFGVLLKEVGEEIPEPDPATLSCRAVRFDKGDDFCEDFVIGDVF